MKLAFLDFETASGADIKLGGRYYARHPSTRIVCCVVRVGEEQLSLGYPFGAVQAAAVAAWLRLRDVTHIVAHNGDSFDKFIAGKFAPELLNFMWIDTIHMARAGGMPAGLDDLAHWFLGEGKDAGKELMLKVAKLKYDPIAKTWGNKWFLPGYLNVVLRYCEQDVVLLQRLWSHLFPYYSPQAVALDNAINERGIGFDEKLAAKIAEVSAQLMAESMAEIVVLTGGKLKDPTALRSQVLMPAWLASQGIKLENLRKETVKRFIDESIYTPVVELIANEEELESVGEQLNDTVKRVLQLRSSALRITASKLERASAVCHNGRLHDLRIHNGAHTKRRTGRIVQPHNLPSGVEGLNVEDLCGSCKLDDVRREATRLGCSPDDVLSTLIRPTLIPAPGYAFAIADFSKMELCILAWLADQADLIEALRTGSDPYTLLAAKVYKVDPADVTKTQRKVAKVLTLASGFCGGAGTVSIFAMNNGVKFDEIGFTPQELVEAYRDAYPNIAGTRTGSYFKGVACRVGGLWKTLDKALRKAIDDETVTTNRITFRKDGTNVEMVLPSGEFITYRKAAIENHRFPGDDEPRECIMYTHPVKGRRTIHGGIIAQNLTESIGNNLLNLGMGNCEDDGIPVVLEVHDEIVAEVKLGTERRALDAMIGFMSTVPPWAEGLPMKATGHTAPRYVKAPWRGWYHVD